MNLDLEVQNLRYALVGKGWEDREIDEICDLAANDLNIIVLDVVENAVAEAVDYAASVGADEFIDDLAVVPDADGLYRIWSRSGKTDYSRPETEMLPHLLKNADIAADGSRYKVIPVKQEGKSRIGSSMFDMMQARQAALQVARASLKDRAADRRSPRANTMAESFRNSLSQQMRTRRTAAADDNSGPINFRTVSEKQDARKDWVIPEKIADISQYLYELNGRIRSTIEDAATEIIDGYYKEYVAG